MAHRLSSAGTCLEPRWRGPHRGRGRGDRRPRRSGLALAAPWRGIRRDAPSFLYRHSFSEMPFTHRAARPCEAPCSVFSSPLQGAQSHPSLVLEPVCLPLHRKPRTRQQLALPRAPTCRQPPTHLLSRQLCLVWTCRVHSRGRRAGLPSLSVMLLGSVRA